MSFAPNPHEIAHQMALLQMQNTPTISATLPAATQQAPMQMPMPQSMAPYQMPYQQQPMTASPYGPYGAAPASTCAPAVTMPSAYTRTARDEFVDLQSAAQAKPASMPVTHCACCAKPL